MTVVFDSNIWVSALLRGGSPLRAITEVAVRGELVISDQIELEIARIMSAKFDWTEARTTEAIYVYLQSAVRVHVQGTVMGVCRDPKDNMVLETALLGSAGMIVTGDRDLLEIGSFADIRIITLREFTDLAPKFLNSLL